MRLHRTAITILAGAFFIAFVTAVSCDTAEDSSVQLLEVSDKDGEFDADEKSVAQLPSTEPIQVGRNVGERVLEFTITHEDGKQESSDELVALGRPVFMYFFASWCPTCRKDLAELATIYPEFSDHMDFIVIGQDPTESLASLMSYRDNQRHPWPVALPSNRMLTELRITSQSFKLAFDAEGVIVYREGYGGGNVAEWRAVMETLTGK